MFIVFYEDMEGKVYKYFGYLDEATNYLIESKKLPLTWNHSIFIKLDSEFLIASLDK